MSFIEDKLTYILLKETEKLFLSPLVFEIKHILTIIWLFLFLKKI